MSTLDSFFESVTLPSMSEVAHDLIRTLNDDSASVGMVRNIIAKDPALTARLLRLANSAQFGLPRGVGTLDDAIAMVGMARVRTLSVGTCLNDSFPALPGLDRNAFWGSCTACAGYSQWLAEHLGIDSQLAWLTGLMLRLGEVLIAQREPALLQTIEAQPSQPGSRWAREIQLIGFSEGQITAELARRWNFPMQMVQALQRSADPTIEQAFSRLGAIIHLAALLADMADANAKSVELLPPEVLDALQLDFDWMQSSFPPAGSFTNVAQA
jgi:HD-like signal output (HDOD) protein